MNVFFSLKKCFQQFILIFFLLNIYSSLFSQDTIIVYKDSIVEETVIIVDTLIDYTTPEILNKKVEANIDEHKSVEIKDSIVAVKQSKKIPFQWFVSVGSGALFNISNPVFDTTYLSAGKFLPQFYFEFGFALKKLKFSVYFQLYNFNESTHKTWTETRVDTIQIGNSTMVQNLQILIDRKIKNRYNFMNFGFNFGYSIKVKKLNLVPQILVGKRITYIGKQTIFDLNGTSTNNLDKSLIDNPILFNFGLEFNYQILKRISIFLKSTFQFNDYKIDAYPLGLNTKFSMNAGLTFSNFKAKH